MRTRPLVLVAIAVAIAGSPAAAGLTLLDRASEAGDEHVRVRVDEPPLEARVVTGSIELAEAEASPEPTVLELPASPWRGFANVTTVTLEGDGSLLLADEASAVLLVTDAEPHASAPASAERDDGAQQRGNASEEPPPAHEEPEDASQDARPDASSPGGEAGPASSRLEASDSGSEESGLPVDPALVGLGLTAVGAFVVELVSRSRWRDA